MEIFVGVVALLCPLAMIILPIVALQKIGDLRREVEAGSARLRAVEAALQSTQAEVRRLRDRVPAPAVEAPAVEAPSSSARVEEAPPHEAPEEAPAPADEAQEAAPGGATDAVAEPATDAPEPPEAPASPDAPPVDVPGWRPLSAAGPASPGPAAPPAAAEGPPPSPAAAPKPAFDLERWIGIRGAAVLGGAILALAGLLLFKYSIEAGLISPTLRVLAGTVAGLGLIGAAQTRWLRRYGITADALAGAGCAALYAAIWASHSLYDLVPSALAFAGMAAVTATCCVLSVRHDSRVIALLGLIGGFLTPLLISTDVEHPLGRFTYILLLDVGLLVLARMRGWTVLAALSLLGTIAYQALWVAGDMGPGDLGVGIVILGVFAAVFALAGRGQEGGMRATQAAALLIPTAFSLWFVLRSPPQGDLWANGLLLFLLNGAGAWLAREQKEPGLAIGLAGASMPAVAAWLLHGGSTGSMQVDAGLVMLGIAGLHHAVAELSARRGGTAAGAPVAAAMAALVAVLGLGAMPGSAHIWTGQAVALAAAALLLRQARIGEASTLPALAAVLLAGAQLLPPIVHLEASGFPPDLQWFALVLATAGGLLALGRALGDRPTLDAANLHPLVVLFGLLAVDLGVVPSLTLLVGALALGVLAVVTSTLRGGGRSFALALLGVAAVALAWLVEASGPDLSDAGVPVMAVLALSAAFFSLWPHVVPTNFTTTTPWRASASGAWAFFLPLSVLWDDRWGDDLMGLLPVLLAILPILGLARLRDSDLADPPRTSALAWTAAAAIGLLCVAVPMQFDDEWITVGWALQGVGVLWLWQRIDHPGLKHFALALFAAVGVRLLLNPEVLGYHPRGSMRILNWLAWTYLVPAGAMLFGSKLLAAFEVERRRPWERSLFGASGAVLAGSLGFLGLAVVFAWLNLTVVDWFARDGLLSLDFSRLQARDLAFSFVWAGYALALLVLGVAREGRSLRWASLGLLMITLVKVFLYDLGELEDLYRVASLVGLAFSLIGVSLLYQRFVFREEPEAQSTSSESRPM